MAKNLCQKLKIKIRLKGNVYKIYLDYDHSNFSPKSSRRRRK